MRPAFLFVLIFGFIGASSCTDFDREDRIEDMRVLAIKTEPAEILYSPFHLTAAATRPPILPLPTTTVDIEVFAYDPRGGRTKMSLQLCPEGAGDATCRLYDRELDLLEEPEGVRDELRALLEPQVTESEIDLETNPLGRVAPNEVTWQFTPAVIDFFIPDVDGTPVPSIFPVLPRVVAISENLDQQAPNVVKERAFKRIPVALDLTSADLPPEVVDDLAAGLGIALCSEPIPDAEFELQGRASCLQPRLPNNNPVLTGWFPQDGSLGEELREGTLTRADLEGEEILDGDVIEIEAEPGAVVQITPVFDESGSAPNSVEKYQVISFDIEANKIIILNRVEDLACTWYSTRGEVSQTLTAEQFTNALGVTWTLPTDAEPGQTDVLVMVVLDQRGGTAVGEISVKYP